MQELQLSLKKLEGTDRMHELDGLVMELAQHWVAQPSEKVNSSPSTSSSTVLLF